MERSVHIVENISAGALLLVAAYAVVALGGTTAGAHLAIEFASFTIAALATPWLILSHRPRRAPIVLALCAAIPAWGALQLILGISASDFDTRNAILDSAVFGALFFISGQMLRNPALRRRVLEALFGLGFTASVAALVSPPVLSPMLHDIDPGHYCVFVELLLPIGLYSVCDAKDKKTAYVWAALSTSLIASALIMGSRAGCVLVALEVVAVPALMYLRKHALIRKTRAPILAMAGLIVIFAIAVGFGHLALRFEPVDTANSRGALVDSAMRMAADRPWTGFGLGSFGAAYPAYAPIGTGLAVDHAYNDWVEWTATGGIPLLVMYLAVFGLTMPIMIRHTWALGVAAMCLHALAGFPFEIPALLVLSAILMGAASAGAD